MGEAIDLGQWFGELAPSPRKLRKSEVKFTKNKKRRRVEKILSSSNKKSLAEVESISRVFLYQRKNTYLGKNFPLRMTSENQKEDLLKKVKGLVGLSPPEYRKKHDLYYYKKSRETSAHHFMYKSLAKYIWELVFYQQRKQLLKKCYQLWTSQQLSLLLKKRRGLICISLDKSDRLA